MKQTLVLPQWRDPRMFFLLFLLGVAPAIILTPSFARGMEHFLLSFAVCVISDLILGGYSKDKVIFPVSAAVSSFGIAVFIDSPYLWPTALAAFLAMLSKNWLRFQGQHLFNPANFGITMLMFGFPDLAASGTMRFGGNATWSAAFIGIGLMLVILADRWAVSLSYVLTFCMTNFLNASIKGLPFWSGSLALLGPGLQLAIFFMITDPRTSPNDRKRQIFFGAAVAFVDCLFRYQKQIQSINYAVFLVCLSYNVFRLFQPDQKTFNVWKTKEITLFDQTPGQKERFDINQTIPDPSPPVLTEFEGNIAGR